MFAEETTGIQSDIVGYNTATIQGTDESGNTKWHLLAVQFKDVAGTTDAISLTKALDMTNVPAYAGTWKTKSGKAPTLQIWDGSSFESYWYVAPACSGLANNAWVSGTAKTDVGPTTMLKAGDAVWFIAPGLGTDSASITFAGAVKSDTTATVAIGSGTWNMGANPYPTEYAISKIVPSFAAYTGTWKTKSGKAPTLQTWDGTSFESYWYVAPACSGLEKDAWVTGTSKAETTDKISAGAGFWFMNVSGEEGTLTFKLEQ